MLQWLLIPHTKKDAEPITVDMLLGRKPKKPPARTFANPAAAAEAFFAAREAKSRQGELTDGR